MAGDIGSELPPSHAGKGLIVNSLVTDWGWGMRLRLGQRHLWGESMQTAVFHGFRSIPVTLKELQTPSELVCALLCCSWRNWHMLRDILFESKDTIVM